MTPHLFRRTARVVTTAAVTLATLGLTSPATPAEPHPAGVRSIALPGSDAALRALPARRTEPFSMVGVTWADPRAELGGTAQVRTRDRATGVWSGWRELELDVRTPEAGPDAGAGGVRAGTQPLWTGPADGVQVRVTGRHGGRSRLPEGLRVELVDPAGGSASAPARTIATATATAASTAPQPAVTPRSGWGADESLVKDPATYTTDTKVVFAHHTAGTNDYTCAQSPDIIRAIFLYHVQSQGWNDIGYQFLVDKCGTVFEGRAGGIDKPVLGAQTYGFNTDTSGVAVLGNYNDALSSSPVREAVAAVAAWKLGLHGYDAAGTVVLTAAADNGKYTKGQKVTLNRISGHRDGYPTECPGNNLYADLPAIRALAAAAQAG
ncbi:N-acetylmuramoyl-L-alanine amidase [Streptomyces glaucescens]|uniref:N-acetylmuramoyl-L-alanine amidase family protein n=1 Tax=Streptomyces glaucescens TaxID=1907 RepID=A0A089WXQ1_STRGA|nr:N-acetylmuramoyl-L-alanine amidase [Streptomyces glaucescens]AIR96202.1 N-acetylmuramoyl-L-alanine amidase family protein [Streptomyces glaucescens]